MSSEAAIILENIEKVYRIYDKPSDRLLQMATLGKYRPFTEFAALNDVSLVVNHGETIGIVGRNGCGKSTLLQVICGILQPTRGTVRVNGRIAALLELGAGFNPEFTGRENVYLNGAILGFSQAEMEARFDQIANFANIGRFIERPVKTYSSGMFVRLAFAVATCVDPDILIVDEALSVGDEAFQRKCFARIEEIKARGGTILFVSHSSQSIIQLCDRAVLIEDGRKILEGTPKDIVMQYHRLINANDAHAAIVKNEIMALFNEHPVSVDTIETNTPVPISDLDDELYDEEMMSQSAISLESRGAFIFNVHIKNKNGKLVNVLRTNGRYSLEYSVIFKESAENVGFGMFIRTVNGGNIGGSNTINDKSKVIDKIQEGSSVEVKIDFDNILLSGVYFVTCGVEGVVRSENTVLHRIFDAFMFKVEPEERTLASGYVDLNCNHIINIDSVV